MLYIPPTQEQSRYARRPSGLVVPEAYARPTPLAVDLFCGAGGFSLGLMQAGIQIVAAVDHDPEAAITYLYNLGAGGVQIHFLEQRDRVRFEAAVRRVWGLKPGPGDLSEKDLRKLGNRPITVSGGNWHQPHPDVRGVPHFYFGDIRRLTGERILADLGLERGELDLVVGGPPCQGFTTSGRREVMDPRNSLVFEFARLVLELNPRAMAMENVPGMLSMVTPEGVPVVDALCRVLNDGGFGAYDALKRSLLVSAGVGGALGRRHGPRAPTEARPAQPALFEEVP